MIRNKIHKNILNIPKSNINHGSGVKRVFVHNEDTNTALTQFAWSRLVPGESCDNHIHPTMDEYFFVHKGGGEYIINDEKIILKEGDFIRIPANTPHELSVDDTDGALELIYFGIALEK